MPTSRSFLRRALLVGATVLVFAMPGEAAAQASSDPACAPRTKFWLATGDNINYIRTGDYWAECTANYAFNRSDSVAATTAMSGFTKDPTQFGFAAARTLAYSNYAVPNYYPTNPKTGQVVHVPCFRCDFFGGRIPPAVRTVIYDLEDWYASPEVEKRDPWSSMENFCAFARAQGFRCITLPAPNVAYWAQARGSRRAGETPEDAYLRLGIARSAAKNASSTGLQTQLFAYDVPRYEQLVRDNASQSRSSNPNAKVIAEFTVSNDPDKNEPPRLLTPTENYNAYKAVRSFIDAVYVAIPKAGDPVEGPERIARMREFVRRVRVQGE